MTSRRSMLKWIPAACLGGWWGLGRKAAAGAIAAASPASAKLIECTYESAASAGPDTAAYTCWYKYDADGRLIWAKDGDGQTFYYNYCDAGQK